MLKTFMLAIATSLIAAAMTPSFAAPKGTPGHMMQRFGSVPGHPGASGYAPGHLKRFSHVRSARNFAPGHSFRHHREHRVRHVHYRTHHRVHHRTRLAR